MPDTGRLGFGGQEISEKKNSEEEKQQFPFAQRAGRLFPGREGKESDPIRKSRFNFIVLDSGGPSKSARDSEAWAYYRLSI
jgi:hypothetical protein